MDEGTSTYWRSILKTNFPVNDIYLYAPELANYYSEGWRDRIYKIPEHSRYITVEATEEGITTIFEPDDTGAFICEITEELEYIPSKNELSIFWGNSNSKIAVIGKLRDIQLDEDGCVFEANTGLWYDHAIRFRNSE